MPRYQMNDNEIREQAKVIDDLLRRRLMRKGRGIFVTRHEIMGVILEEKYECVLALHGKNPEELYSELADLAVGCIVGMVSIRSGKME